MSKKSKVKKENTYARIAGERIRAARLARALTRHQLAGMVGLLPSTLGNYEQGLRQLPPHISVRLEKVLSVPAAYLLGVVDGERAALLSRPLEDVHKIVELLKLVPLNDPRPPDPPVLSLSEARRRKML